MPKQDQATYAAVIADIRDLLLLLPGGDKPPEPSRPGPGPITPGQPVEPFPGGLAMLQAADGAYDLSKTHPENFVAMLQAVMRLTQYADVWGLRTREERP